MAAPDTSADTSAGTSADTSPALELELPETADSVRWVGGGVLLLGVSKSVEAEEEDDEEDTQEEVGAREELSLRLPVPSYGATQIMIMITRT
jgi:hypothetical protein